VNSLARCELCIATRRGALLDTVESLLLGFESDAAKLATVLVPSSRSSCACLSALQISQCDIAGGIPLGDGGSVSSAGKAFASAAFTRDDIRLLRNSRAAVGPFLSGIG
jgi:hypothetical protein